MDVSKDNVENGEPNSSQEKVVTWFYKENGIRKGEINEEEIIPIIENGKITYGTSVWKAGFSDWLKQLPDIGRNMEHYQRLLGCGKTNGNY